MWQNKKTLIALIGINVVIFLIGIELTVGGQPAYLVMQEKGALILGGAVNAWEQNPLRYLFSMFLHADYNHLYNNMITLLIFGYYLIDIVGEIRFLLIYFIGGMGANVLSIYAYAWTHPNSVVISIGASGAVYAVIGAFVVAVIFTRGHTLRFHLWRSVILLIGGLFFGTSAGINNAAHLGGLLTGAAVMAILMIFRNTRLWMRRF